MHTKISSTPLILVYVLSLFGIYIHTYVHTYAHVHMCSNLCTVFISMYICMYYICYVIQCNVPIDNICTYLMLSNITHAHISSLPFIDGVATLGVGISAGHGPEVIFP